MDISHGAKFASSVLAVIKTRWLVAVTVIVVAAIGVLVYTDETARSEAALDDLGVEQAAVAQAASVAIDVGAEHDKARSELTSLAHPGISVVMVREPAGELRTLDGQPITARAVVSAIDHGAGTLRLEPADAVALGLPERTAMVGIARGRRGAIVAVASSAEHQRDRDRQGRMRVLLSMVLAASVMSGFAALLWRQQRSEAELARELAVAESTRSRDAELDRLGRAATMAALGSGVAHELSTPLGVIVGRAEQLVARLTGDERGMKNAQAILEQADHINSVVRGLLKLARGAPIALQSVEARSLVHDAAALVEHRFQRAHVNLLHAVHSGLPELRCDPLLFKHALINLLLNACDASPAKTTVRVDVHADAFEIAFMVTDEGTGIDERDASRAVEPFFTTKPEGQGTGLGLAIANEIAKTHRGTLEIRPRLAPQRGTRACIRIPIDGTST
jgi:two-component system NtrC family sensor kinase